MRKRPRSGCGARWEERLDASRRALAEINHVEVFLRVPGSRVGHTGNLGVFVRGAFGILHQDRLKRLLAGLPPGPRAGALRGRILWLLGRDEEAESVLASRSDRDPEAAAYLAAALTPRDPAHAERILSSVLRALPSGRDALAWRAAARLVQPGRAVAALSDLDRLDALAGGSSRLSLRLRTLAAIASGRWLAAEAAAERLIALAPEESAGWFYRFQARLAQGEYAAAEADYHEARNRDADSGGFYMLDGNWRRGLPLLMEDRLRYYDRAVRRHPDLAVLRAERAEIYRERGVNRFDLSLREYRALEKRFEKAAWFQAHMARAEASVLGLKASLPRIESACRLFPGGGWIFAWKGETLRRLQRDREAVRDFDRAIRLHPWYGYAHAWRGAALQSLGRWMESRRALDAALAMDITFPTDAYALQLRAVARGRLGDWAGVVNDRTAAFHLDAKYVWLPERQRDDRARVRQALDELRCAEAARSRRSWTRAWRGQVLLVSGAFQEAERALNGALRLEPDLSWARTWRAEARLGLGREAAAEADLRTVLRLDPQQWRAAEKLSELLSGRGRLLQALSVLNRCAKGNPTAARFFARRADVLRRLGRNAGAEESARRALALDPDYADARAILAAALLGRGKAEEAKKEAGRALATRPDLELALLTRGVARGRLGDASGQAADMREVDRLRPKTFR